MPSPNTITPRRGAPVGVWFKSSYSNPNGNQCVEVVITHDLVHVRDSKNLGAGPVLDIPTHLWPTFLDEATGQAPVGTNPALQITHHLDGSVDLSQHTASKAALSYTAGEWSAFIDGIRNAEFDLPATVAA